MPEILLKGIPSTYWASAPLARRLLLVVFTVGSCIFHLKNISLQGVIRSQSCFFFYREGRAVKTYGFFWSIHELGINYYKTTTEDFFAKRFLK
jgi:hypothetical protein